MPSLLPQDFVVDAQTSRRTGRRASDTGAGAGVPPSGIDDANPDVADDQAQHLASPGADVELQEVPSASGVRWERSRVKQHTRQQHQDASNVATTPNGTEVRRPSTIALVVPRTPDDPDDVIDVMAQNPAAAEAPDAEPDAESDM